MQIVIRNCKHRRDDKNRKYMCFHNLICFLEVCVFNAVNIQKYIYDRNSRTFIYITLHKVIIFSQ